MGQRNWSSKRQMSAEYFEHFGKQSVWKANVDSRKAAGFRVHFWENKLFIVAHTVNLFFSWGGNDYLCKQRRGSGADLLEFTRLCCHAKLKHSFLHWEPNFTLSSRVFLRCHSLSHIIGVSSFCLPFFNHPSTVFCASQDAFCVYTPVVGLESRGTEFSPGQTDRLRPEGLFPVVPELSGEECGHVSVWSGLRSGHGSARRRRKNPPGSKFRHGLLSAG